MTTQRIIAGDCIEGMRTLSDGSVHCCVTSPPYWGLRDYGHAGQIGLEETPEAYVARMVEVFREVRRVLRDDGTLWLNLGDSYAGSWGNQGRKETRGTQRAINGPMLQRLRGGKMHAIDCCLDDECMCPAGEGDDICPDKKTKTGSWVNDHPTLKPKDLVGIPWRVAFALQADGWWLRQDIIWAKPNPMPESVRDRCTKAHEYVFLLTKSERYFYDAEAVSEAATGRDPCNSGHKYQNGAIYGEPSRMSQSGLASIGPRQARNRRSVWTVTTKPYSGAHFATMPPDLVEPCILAGTSDEGCCPECGKPLERVVERETIRRERPNAICSYRGINGQPDQTKAGVASTTLGWRPACTCGGSPVPCTVLDPFAGSGTTLAVAAMLGRNAIGCELNPDYITLAEQRIRDARQRNALFEGVPA